MTIGSAEDIRAARLDDVRAFFQTYYRPRNASLALAGDVDTDQVLALAARLLRPARGRRASLPRSCSPRRPRLTSESRLLLEDRVELPRLYIAWHSPGAVCATTTRSWIWWPSCWRAGRRRACIARSCTKSGSPPRSRPRRTPARLAASSRSWPRRRPGRTLAGARARDRRARSRRLSRRARPTSKWSAAWRRRKPISSTGCKRSAASAASPIS